MSSFQITRNACISTPLPYDMDPTPVIAALHDHEGLISLNPHASTAKKINTTDAITKALKMDFPDSCSTDSIAAYQVQQDVPLYGRSTLLAVFRDQHNGVDSVVDAPMGLRIAIKWRVSLEIGADGQRTGRMVLKEDCKVHSSMMLLPLMSSFIMPNLKKAHCATHARLLERINVDSFLDAAQA